ncbi:hypothetical protein BC830DRAFT_1102611 [Chytriomyces sp. MP71]|nr:hypothetical protein BC830DRAFT_1102611 [Chytriomyces sp. MP71]
MHFPTFMVVLLHVLPAPNSAMPVGFTGSGNTDTVPTVLQPNAVSAQSDTAVVAQVSTACATPYKYACDAKASQMMQCIEGVFAAIGAPCKCQYINGVPGCVL